MGSSHNGQVITLHVFGCKPGCNNFKVLESLLLMVWDCSSPSPPLGLQVCARPAGHVDLGQGPLITMSPAHFRWHEEARLGSQLYWIVPQR